LPAFTISLIDRPFGDTSPAVPEVSAPVVSAPVVPEVSAPVLSVPLVLSSPPLVLVLVLGSIGSVVAGSPVLGASVVVGSPVLGASVVVGPLVVGVSVVGVSVVGVFVVGDTVVVGAGESEPDDSPVLEPGSEPDETSSAPGQAASSSVPRQTGPHR